MFKLLLLSLFFYVALAADLRIDKKNLPKILDVTTRTLFHEFPGTFCRATLNPPTSFLKARPVVCASSADAPYLSGGFANTTCFKLESIVGSVTQLKILCASEGFTQVSEQNVRVTIVDSAPVCRNTTIVLSPKGEAKFFLRADDSDDDNILFHVREKSLTDLEAAHDPYGKGILNYCIGCGGDKQGSPDDEKNWKSYNEVVNGNEQHRFSRMFSYKVPGFAPNESYQQTLFYTATDISDKDCPHDGEIHFISKKIDQPTVTAEKSLTSFVGRPQTFPILGSGTSPRINFRLKSVPSRDCAILCRVPDGARTLLRDFPTVALSGGILEPCTVETALKADDDISLFSATKDTFFGQTFVTVKVIKSCSSASFSFVSVDEGIESEKAEVSIQSKEISQRCVPFSHTFKPSESVTFKASQFVSSPGPFSVTQLSKSPSFDLQSGAAKIDSTKMTTDSTLVFVGARNVDVTLMVEASNPPWTGFCSLSFRSSEQTPSPPTPLSPAPSKQQETTTAPASPTNVLNTNEQSKPFNFTVLFFFIVVIVIVAYFFRDGIFRFFCGKRGNSQSSRRYGVVSSVDEE